MLAFFTIKHLEKIKYKISLVHNTPIQMMGTQDMDFLDLVAAIKAVKEVKEDIMLNLNKDSKAFMNSQGKVIHFHDKINHIIFKQHISPYSLVENSLSFL